MSVSSRGESVVYSCDYRGCNKEVIIGESRRVPLSWVVVHVSVMGVTAIMVGCGLLHSLEAYKQFVTRFGKKGIVQ